MDELTRKLIAHDGITATHGAVKKEEHMQADEHKQPSTLKVLNAH